MDKKTYIAYKNYRNLLSKDLLTDEEKIVQREYFNGRVII